jgi:CRP/FNR family transcriptional regulator
MVQRQITAELATIQLFHNLPDHMLDRLANTIGEQYCATGDVLIQPNEDPRRVYIVRRGGLKVVMRLQTERPLVLAFLGRGALVGELGMIQAEHGRSAAVIALDDTDLLWLERRAFQEFLDQSMQLTRNLVAVLAQRLRHTNEQLWLRGEPSIARRVAWVLSRLAEEYGVPQGSSLAIPFRFVQQDLADLIGSTRSRVNQQLGAISKTGIIFYDAQRRYLVRDPQRLQRIAEGVEEDGGMAAK